MPALLLDFDGTLCASLPALKDVFIAFMAAHGRTVATAEFDAINGPPLRVFVADLKRRYDLAAPLETLIADYAARAAAAQQAAPASPGATDLLAAARRRDWRVAVVSSAESGRVRDWLAGRNLAGQVDAVVGGGDVTRTKPAPEPYLHALALLGVAASAALAVEDSVAGLAAALAAGIRTYSVLEVTPEIEGHPHFAGLTDLPALAAHLAQLPPQWPR